ncbi:MAG: type II secretion system F family protein [Hyphomicrobiales bacterium]|nr:type II secretion system F family protein [Hyphomicrobiales bacterium]
MTQAFAAIFAAFAVFAAVLALAPSPRKPLAAGSTRYRAPAEGARSTPRGLVLGAMASLAAGGAALMGLGAAWIVALVLAAALGGCGPLLTRLRERRLRRDIARGLPDALDMIALCLRAGAHPDAAIAKTAEHLAPLHPAVALELSATAAELRFSPSRAAAYRNLATRTNAPGLKDLAAHLALASQSGAPAARAIAEAAADMRAHRLAEAERRAASLPARLSAPLVIFFLPAVFVVVLGPALLRFFAGG